MIGKTSVLAELVEGICILSKSWLLAVGLQYFYMSHLSISS
jgi:hypothetical protein